MSNRQLFENWFLKNFGATKRCQLEWSQTGGYESGTINALWIGFNGGLMLASDIEANDRGKSKPKKGS